MTNPLQVIIVDDDSLVRTGLRLLLRSETNIVVSAEARNGAEALLVLANQPCDVVVMDVRMPGSNGLATAQLMRAQFPGVRIILMTSFADHEFAAHALNSGAHAFVPKTAAAEDFVAAIMGPMTNTLSAPAQISPLSGRERTVVNHIAAGLNNDEIAVQMNLSPNTVKTYVSRIFTKMNVRNRVELVNQMKKL